METLRRAVTVPADVKDCRRIAKNVIDNFLECIARAEYIAAYVQQRSI